MSLFRAIISTFRRNFQPHNLSVIFAYNLMCFLHAVSQIVSAPDVVLLEFSWHIQYIEKSLLH